jgi:site-specific DNA-methyltransferase (adenine-specific)
MSCERKIGPYSCCSVVQGDCLELMKLLPDGCVDAVITDPPYGVDWNTDYSALNTSGTRNHPAQVKTYERITGDSKPFDPTSLLRFEKLVLFGANCYSNKLSKGSWLVWDKRAANGHALLADAEAAWMNSGHGIYLFSHCWHGFARASENSEHYHPTQKPVALMAWCIGKAGNPEIILDPYCGSGSTLVAAKKLGRHFLGFEISPEYCEIARKRIALVEAQPTLFEPKPEQTELEL